MRPPKHSLLHLSLLRPLHIFTFKERQSSQKGHLLGLGGLVALAHPGLQEWEEGATFPSRGVVDHSILIAIIKVPGHLPVALQLGLHSRKHMRKGPDKVIIDPRTHRIQLE